MSSAIHRSRLACCLAASVVGCLLAAAPAGAYLTDLQVTRASSPFNSATAKTANAICPPGTRVIGGAGFVSPAFSNLALQRLAPVFNRFEAGGAETDSIGAGWRVLSRAHCVRPTGASPFSTGGVGYVKAVQVVSVQSGFGPGFAKSQTATCPPGKQVISGGGSILPAGNDFAFRSMQRIAGGTRWRVTAGRVDATNAPWRLRAFAVCANLFSPAGAGPPSYAAAPVFELASTGPFSSAAVQGRARVCPGGFGAVGGGARLLANSNVALTESRPLLGPGGFPTGWFAVARETDPTGAGWRLQVRVSCARLNFPGP